MITLRGEEPHQPPRRIDGHAAQPVAAVAPDAPARTLAAKIWDRMFSDYNARAIAYWFLLVGVGLAALGYSVFEVVQFPVPRQTEVGLIAVIASLVGLFPLRVPKSKNSIAAGDIFIFLMLVLHGPFAASLAAAAESGVCAWRTSTRWTSRLASPAGASLAMLVCGFGYEAVLVNAFGALLGQDLGTFAALMAFALIYFALSPTLVTTVIYLKRGRAPSLREWLESFAWIGLGYVSSASITAVLYLAFRQFGVSTIVYAAPMVGLFLALLHFFFARQEAAEREAASRQAQERAEAAERAAAQSARHLQELEESDKRFHSAFTHAAIGMALVKLDGNVFQLNRAMCALLGRTEDQAARGSFRDFVNPLDAALLEQEMQRIRRRENDGFQLELRLRHAGGRELWASLHCSFFANTNDGDPSLIFQAFDVTARRLAEARMQHMAYHDGLTNLANRSRLHEALAQAIEAKNNDPGRSFAVMCLAFDRIKLLNDSFGIAAGDKLLVKVARRLKEQVGPFDVVARLGGDQFAVLASSRERGREGLIAMAERLQASFSQPFEFEDTEVTTGITVGITLSDVGYLTPDEALRDADLAHQRARANGQSRLVVFDANLHERAKERLLLEAELRRAIAASQMSLAFQPIFEIDTRRIVGFEALARWEHPERGAVSPAHFIPVAEDSGLIGSLTQWAIRRACKTLRGWLDRLPNLEGLYVNVNISGQDLCDPKFAESVGAILAQFQLDPVNLKLEITENTLMQQLEAGSDSIARLRAMGVDLSVDDFGTGYSSLAYLSALPVSSLKVDRSFVSKVDRNAGEAEIVRAVVQLGDALGKYVIAEGIETQAQLDQLQALGCEFGQGFLLSKPVTAEDALRQLEALAAKAPQAVLALPSVANGSKLEQGTSL